MDEKKTVRMIFMGQKKDIPEYDVEDALCSGWLPEDEGQEPKRSRGRPAKG